MIRRCLFVVLGWISISLPLAAQPSGLAGYWAGAFSMEGSVQLINLDIEAYGDSLAGYATMPYRGGQRFPIRLNYEAPTLQIFLGRSPIPMHVDLERGMIRGTLQTRAGEGQVYFQRTLKPPQPRLIEEDASFAAEGVTLAGTLVRPAGSGRHPVVIFVTGRSNGSRLAHYRQAVQFAERGVAGLVFDSRGTGQSGGDRATLTDHNRYADVLAAIAWVKARPDLDPTQIGIYSNSAGAWVTPVVIERSGDIAFWIMNVGPAESLADQQGWVPEYRMRWSDNTTYTEADFEAAFAYQKRLVELAISDASWEVIAAHVATSEGHVWAEYVDRPESMDNSELDYYRRRTTFNPVPHLKKVTIPVLALYGEDDFVVPPEENVSQLEAYLTEAGNTDFQIEVFADVGHGMMLSSGFEGEGAWPEWFYRWTNPQPHYDETILNWLLEHVTLVD